MTKRILFITYSLRSAVKESNQVYKRRRQLCLLVLAETLGQLVPWANVLSGSKSLSTDVNLAAVLASANAFREMYNFLKERGKKRKSGKIHFLKFYLYFFAPFLGILLGWPLVCANKLF
jgi:hypothetical protein